MSTVITGASLTTDTINYDTAKDEAKVFTKQQVVQIVNVTDGAVATGTTTIAWDDTIPQITEGNEFMTLAITPKSTSNILVVEVSAMLSGTAAVIMVGALFQDSTADALAVAAQDPRGNNSVDGMNISHYLVAGTTSATTFRFRAGAQSAATTTFNGSNSGRKFGGAVASSITITEYTP